jgi:glycerol-3-phosphate dehydrogenase
MAEVLIENAEYLRCEIEHAARREMVVKLDDFLRRRSKISLVVSRETLREAQGLTDACRILFGDEAEARLEEYFRETEAEAIPRGDAPERDIEVEAQHAAS